MTRIFRICLLGAGLIAVAAVTACDEPVQLSETELLQRAKDYRLEGDYRAATVELKNVLRQNPNSAAARWALGQVYVDVGDGHSAEKELLRAKALGMDIDALFKLLGEAWLLMGEYEKILDKIRVDGDDTAIAKGSKSVLRGKAYIELDQLDDARTQFQDALEFDAKSVSAFAGLARVAMYEQDLEKAESFQAKARELSPSNQDVLRVQGDMLYLKEDFAGSGSAFSEILKTRSSSLTAAVGLARARLALDEIPETIKILDGVLKFAPNSASALYLRGVAAYRSDDFEGARNFADRVVEVEGASLLGLLLAGAASYAREEYEQSALYLTKATTIGGLNRAAGRLLADSLMKTGQREQGIEVLRQLAVANPDDAQLVATLGSFRVRKGKIEIGTELLQQAVELDPDQSAVRLRLGLVYASYGDQDEGLAEIERAMEADPELADAGLALAAEYLRAGRFDDALSVTEELKQKFPDRPDPFILAGFAYLGKKELAAARNSFDLALAISPDHVGAQFALANMDLLADRPDAARERYREILKGRPGHLPTLMRWEALERQEDNLEKARELIERAAKTNPDAVEPNVLMAQDVLDSGNPDKALVILRGLAEEHRENPNVLNVLGRAQLAANQVGSAVGTYETLVRVTRTANSHVLLAKAYARNNNLDEMQSELDRALAIDPKHFVANFTKIKTFAQRGESRDEVNERLSQFKRDHPGHAGVLALEGWVLTQQEKWEEAFAAYESAFKIEPDVRIVKELAFAKWTSGDGEGAISTLESWLAEHPDDTDIRFATAKYLIEMNRRDEARSHYEKAIEQNPRNWSAYNNIAGIMMDTDLSTAREFVEKAYAIAPNRSSVLDTYGIILHQPGDLEGAVEKFRQSVKNAPNVPDFGLHLARALVDVGKKEEARRILTRILEREVRFPGRGKAALLLRQLNE
jgi:putative PEP-CTERM system TPR-repeat lipoprotein